MNPICRTLALLLMIADGRSFAADAEVAKPNIIVILADDLGYGDVRCLNPDGKIPTPHLDRLAAEGMIFTDAHSSSAVCTPTRYGLLTGRYNWRSRLKSGVLGGMSPPLIEPGRLTLPAFLQQQGYHTACIGKWHLGFDWARKPETTQFTDGIEKGADGWRVDFTKPIGSGPTSMGFNYFFGIAASLDMVPYTFIENDRVTKLPTEDMAFPMMFGRTNSQTRKGPGAAGFEAAEVLPTLTRKAVDYINDRTSKNTGQPFFLYLPLNAPHTPIAPTKEWQGRSGLNPYADFVMQVDAEVGTVLAALDRSGQAPNTLVIFTSDNGCSPEAKFDELRKKGHDPSAQFRGNKADIFDGGHRIPFLARWPGRIKPGGSSDQLICLNDLFATCAEILGKKLPDNAGEDSVSILAALEGRANKPLREALVHHSINGSFAIRQNKWKLEICPDSGGWSAPRPGTPAAQRLPDIQLYDLSRDIGETNNLQSAYPQVVAQLTQLLEKYVADGRSTPGAPQTNTTPVDIHGPHAAGQQPNIVFIFADDLGYGDLGCFGAKDIKTPNIDRLAREGTKFTSFYVAQAVCTASRAAFLTGCYANRVGMAGALNHTSNTGLNPDEKLLSELLKERGYATAVYGKWHLGHREPFLPTRRGFDEWFGIPYSNDNGPLHPVTRGIPSLPLYENEKVVELDPDQSQFTRRITERAVSFIERSKEKPFFLYVPHIMPHVPIFASEKFKGTSGRGLYGDVVQELDWSVGEILAALKKHGLDDRTLVVFTSDNGPFLSYGEHAGSAGALREGKLTTFGGGVDVPCVMRWPGHIPAGRVTDELVTTMDLYVSFARMAGATLPKMKRDGVNLTPLLLGRPGAKGRQAFWFYAGDELQAVRVGKWKLHLPHEYLTVAAEPGKGGKPSNWENMKPLSIEVSGIRGIASRHGYRVEKIGLALYDLKNDPGETNDVASANPAIVARLQAEVAKARADLGDSLTSVKPANARPAGKYSAPAAGVSTPLKP